jgi:multidrug efflux pump subunit AcrB
MNLSDASMRSPFVVIAGCLLVAALGLFAFFRTPTDLFPDTTPPQVLVVTVWPGADSDDIADKITQVIEKELNTLGGLARVTSTSRDEVSSVNAEFGYAKPLGEAVLDVQNAVGRIRAALPGGILEPRIYRISDATRPLLTLALSPKQGSIKDLPQIRLLAENEIEDQLLNLPGVADVDVFGGHQPEVRVEVDRSRLAAHSLSLGDVVAALARHNVTAPAGTVYSSDREFLVKVSGEFEGLGDIRRTPVRYEDRGTVRIADIAEVRLGQAEQRSIYHGNGRPAIAVNVLRPEGGDTVAAIRAVKTHLPLLRAQYPDIAFAITDDQQPIIDLNVSGMRVSLLQAIILTVAVIFLFLADMRAAVIVSVSIPLAFLASLVVLWFSPYTLNMVTLSGLIISVGMVVDASIVVLENIYRHYRDDDGRNARRASATGAREVSLAVTAGMLTTVIVLVPVMFAGGYTQQTMRPLSMMISAALVASLVAALSVVPVMASRLLGHGEHRRNWFERLFTVTDRGVGLLAKGYLRLLRVGLAHRWLVLLLAVVFLGVTMRKVKPLIGGELMPPMDTGIVNIDFETPADFPPPKVEAVLSEIEAAVQSDSGVLSVSSTVGSEPGQTSFGGGGATAQSGRVKVVLVDRTQRPDDDIWRIQDRWRKRLREIRGIRSFRIMEYGATPLSTTRAPLDIIISGPDARMLDELAAETLQILNGTPGLVDVRRSWYIDKRECRVVVDPELAEVYRLPPPRIAEELRMAVKGVPATAMRLQGALDIPVTVRHRGTDIEFPGQLRDVYLESPLGPVPLRALADITPHRTQPFVTRENLLPTIDITGTNRGYTIGHVTGMVQKRLAKLHVPRGYHVELAGTAVDMKVGQQEMGRALLIGIALLFVLLVAMFKSFLHPFTIMSAIPLAVAGGFWGLLLFDKPMCKPAMMGMILLGGTIVNNSILLLDFVVGARERGMPREEAIAEAVRLRLRPVLMTTVSTIVGLSPLILETAVGLERMSPLGIVAACGLLLGTVLTMVVVPVVYSCLDSLAITTGKAWNWFWTMPPRAHAGIAPDGAMQ